jgi:hypothetical protein
MREPSISGQVVAVSCSTLPELLEAREFGIRTILMVNHENISPEQVHLVDYLEVANEFPSDHFVAECLLGGVETVRPTTDATIVRSGSCYIVRGDGTVDAFSSAEPSLVKTRTELGASSGIADRSTPYLVLALDRFAEIDSSTLSLDSYLGLGPVRMERLLTGADRSYALGELNLGLGAWGEEKITQAIERAVRPAVELAAQRGLPLYVRLPFYRWDEEPSAIDLANNERKGETFSRFSALHCQGLVSAARHFRSLNLTILAPMYRQACDLRSAVMVAGQLTPFIENRPKVGVVMETLFDEISFAGVNEDISTVCVGTNDLACAITGLSRKGLVGLNVLETEATISRLEDYLVHSLPLIQTNQSNIGRIMMCGAFSAALTTRLTARGMLVDMVSVRPKGQRP